MIYYYGAPLFLALSWLLALSFTGLDVIMLAGTAALLSCAAAWSLRRGFQINQMSMGLIMAAVLLWFSCSLLWSQAPYRSWLYLISFSTLPLAYFIAQGFGRRQYRFLGIMVLGAGVVLAGWAVLQYHNVFPIQFLFRASASFLDPNSYAALGYLLLFPAVAVCFRVEGRERWLVFAAIVLLVAGISATGSRAGWLIAVVGCSFVLWIYRKEAAIKAVALLLVAAFVFWLVEMQWYSGFELARRMAEDSAGANSPSAQVRFMLWESTWQLIQQGPWWGYGLGTFSLLYGGVRSPQEWVTTGAYVHSDPLQLLLEVGVPGLLLFLLLWGLLGLRLLVLLRKAGSDRGVDVAILLALLMFGAQCLINFNLYNISLTLLLGMMIGYLDRGDEKPDRACNPAILWPAATVWLVLIAVLASDAMGEYLQQPIMRGGIDVPLEVKVCRQAELVSLIRPSMPGMFVHRAACALQHQQGCAAVKEALAAMDQSIQASPLQPELHAMKGQILLRANAVCVEQPVYQGYLEFQRALVANPSYLPARIIIANLEFQSGRREQAKAVLQEGLKYGMQQSQMNLLKQRIAQL